jgi:hypothetical protein
MSLNKFVSTQTGLDLKLEIGADKIVCNSLTVTGGNSGLIYSGTSLSQIAPLTSTPTGLLSQFTTGGVGSLKLNNPIAVGTVIQSNINVGINSPTSSAIITLQIVIDGTIVGSVPFISALNLFPSSFEPMYANFTTTFTTLNSGFYVCTGAFKNSAGNTEYFNNSNTFTIPSITSEPSIILYGLCNVTASCNILPCSFFYI